MILSTLKKLETDARDFSHHILFGTTAPENLPTFDFDIVPDAPAIEDQKNLPDCPACATSELNTIEQRNESDAFDFLYQMAKINQIMNDPSGNGADLRSAAQSLISFGSIKNSETPYTYATGLPTDKQASFLNDWSNWPTTLDLLASKRKLGSFYAADGSNDTFDNFRSILWNNLITMSGSAILFGIDWRNEWTNSPGGVISPVVLPPENNGHATILRGQKTINGVMYLKLQNSWSKNFGDNGIYYLPREIIDQDYQSNFYGAYVFKKISVVKALEFYAKIKP